jgi:hypothetical protein
LRAIGRNSCFLPTAHPSLLLLYRAREDNAAADELANLSVDVGMAVERIGTLSEAGRAGDRAAVVATLAEAMQVDEERCGAEGGRRAPLSWQGGLLGCLALRNAWGWQLWARIQCRPALGCERGRHPDWTALCTLLPWS